VRAVPPPDGARQALRALDLLAHELATVPSALARAGRVREQRFDLFETVAAYTELARAAWEAIAEERLELTGTDPLYRQFANRLARATTDLQEVARQGMRRPTGNRPPWLWRARSTLIRAGLRQWQTCLDLPVDPLRIGAGLYTLHGSLSLALSGTLELLALRLLTGAALVGPPLVAVGLALALAPSLVAGHGPQATTPAVAALGTLLLWMVMLLLTTRGRVRLGFVLGTSCCSPTASPANGQTGSPVVRVLLHAWWRLVGLIGALGTLAALAFSLQFSLRQQLIAGAPLARGSLPTMLGQLGQRLVQVAAPPALVASVALAALAVPALALLAVRMGGELGGNRTWVPAARRYALGPSASSLALLSGALFAAVAWGATALGLQRSTLLRLPLRLPFGTVSLTPTWRAGALFAALALPYLLLHELPYRVGIGRWRTEWRRELARRRVALEAHVRRLAAAELRHGAKDPSDDHLRAMEYDLLRLKFYRAKDVEARAVSASPHGVMAMALVLALAVVLALAADSAAPWLFVLR
jgi:hypothetical protein